MSEHPQQGRLPLAERRQQLLDAALVVMGEKGVAGATTRAITEQAGVPQGLFHYCFDSRHALLRALLERESDVTVSMVAGIDPQRSSLEQALNDSFAAQFQRVSAEPERAAVLSELNVIARTDPDLLALLRAQRTRDLATIADCLSRWLSHPSLRSAAGSWAEVVMAGLDGMTEEWLTSRDDDAWQRGSRLFAEAIAKSFG